jgi:hypothetical protein
MYQTQTSFQNFFAADPSRSVYYHSFLRISFSNFVVITLLIYKIGVGKYTNNYVNTNCAIIRAMITCYCESEKLIHNWF